MSVLTRVPPSSPDEAPKFIVAGEEEHNEPTELDIYVKLIGQQLEGVMHHESMKGWCQVLGLKGFARMHKHQLCEEFETYLKLKSHYIHETKMLPQPEAYEFTQTLKGMEANVNNKQGMYSEWDIVEQTKSMIEHYYKWETKVLKHLVKWKVYLKDKDMINEMIENVMCEIKDIETIMRDLDCEGYEYEYICKVQPYLYHLYK